MKKRFERLSKSCIKKLVRLLLFLSVSATAQSDVTPAEDKRQLLLSYFTKHIGTGEPPAVSHGQQNMVLKRHVRGIDGELRATFRRAELTRMRENIDNFKHLEATAELSQELEKLQRRERWVPPRSHLASEYSLYNGPLSYGANQMQNVVRKLQQVGSSSRQNSISVDSLIRWKSSTQQRIERLERLIENFGSSLSGVPSSSHGEEARSQRSAIEENSRQIDAIQNSIARMQQAVVSLQSPTSRRSSRRGVFVSSRTDFEIAFENSAAYTRQQGSVAQNSNRIQSILERLETLQRDVKALEPLSGDDLNAMRRIENLAGSSRFHASSDVRGILRDHEIRLNGHDVKMRKSTIDITSLQHQLFRLLRKGMERDEAVKALQATFANSSSSDISNFLSGSFSQSGSSVRNVEEVVRKISEHDMSINHLQKSSSKIQLKIDSNIRRMDETIERVNEARTKADESAVVVRVQKRNLDEATNKIETQRIIIKRVQDTLVSQRRNNGRMNRNLQEIIRFKAEELNRTITGRILRRFDLVKDRLSSQLEDLQAQVMKQEAELASTSATLDSFLIQRAGIRQELRRHLDHIFPQFVNDLMRNQTSISKRVNSHSGSIFTMMTRLNEIQVEINTRKVSLEASVKQNRNLLEQLEVAFQKIQHHEGRREAGRDEAMAENVLFLNSSFHHMRAALQRQSDRGATLSSRVQRLRRENGKIKERMTHLAEVFEEHITNSNNETMSLRYMITSDDNSLRRTLGARFLQLERKVRLVNASTSHVAKQQQQLSSIVAGLSDDANRVVSRLERKANAAIASQETLTANYISFREDAADQFEFLNNSLSDLLDARFRDMDDVADNLEEEIARFELRMETFLSNATRRDGQIASLRRHVTRLNRNLNGARHVTNRLSGKTGRLEKTIRFSNTSLSLLKRRISLMEGEVSATSGKSDTNRREIAATRNKLEREVSALSRSQNTTRQLLEGMKLQINGTYRRLEYGLGEANRRVDRLGGQIIRNNIEISLETQRQNVRLMSLETLNSTLLSMMNEWRNRIEVLQDSVEELRHTDVTLIESIEFHDKSLTEHRKLHRNLSALSHGVHSMINQHSEALDTVRDVVVQLNETVEEGKEHIDEAVSSQIKRHLRQIKGLRYIMRNFTSLLQTVLQDKLDQEISVASLRMRQRTILESMGSQSDSIKRLNVATTRIKRSIASLEMREEEQGRQMVEVLSHLSTHDRKLRRQHAVTFRLVDATSQLNSSLMTQAEEIDEIETFLESNRDIIFDLMELLSTTQEDLNEHKTEAEDIINSILSQQSFFLLENREMNKSLAALESWSSDTMATINQFDSNIEFLDVRTSLIAGSMDALAYVDGNITDLRSSIDQVIISSHDNAAIAHNLRQSLLRADRMLAATKLEVSSGRRSLQSQHNRLARQVARLGESRSSIEDQTSDLLSRVEELEHNVSQKNGNYTVATSRLNEVLTSQQNMLLSLLDDVMRQRDDVDRILEKVWEHEASVTSLNLTSLRLTHVVTQLQADSRGYSRSIGKIVRSIEESREDLERTQTSSWNIQSRVNELTSRNDVIEDQVGLLEAKCSGSRARIQSSMRDLQKKVTILETNMTEVGVRMRYLELERDNVLNETYSLHATIQENNHRISILRESFAFEASDVFASLASTIAALQQYMYDVNATISRDVEGITALLVDFQFAFDTSGLQMEQQYHELNILAANASNHFDYFSSSVDYLRLIAHQTNEAVGENRDRVRSLNDSFVILQVALPSLFHEAPPPTIENYPDEQSNAQSYRERNIIADGVSDKSDIEDYEEGYGDGDYLALQAKSPTVEYRSFPGSNLEDYPEEVEYNLASILNGDADDARIARKMTSLMDSSYSDTYDDDYNDYDTDEEEL